MKTLHACSFAVTILLALSGCQTYSASRGASAPAPADGNSSTLTVKVKADATPLEKVIAAGVAQEGRTTGYDPAYTKLKYPGGDVPLETGVCADVIVRAFRFADLDLQKEIHEDMTRNFAAYPNTWGAKKPDSNIDHRRVGNLMKWFERQGRAQPVTKSAKDYAPGDVVAWDLGNGRLHIGLVTDRRAGSLPGQGEGFLMVHNIGAGARIEDVLFSWQVIGHYRYFKGTETAKPTVRAGERTSALKIDFLREEEVSNRAGCHYLLPEDMKKGRENYILFSCEGDRIRTYDAIINIDGQETKLTLVSSSGNKGPWKKGTRIRSVYRAGEITIQVSSVVTTDCKDKGGCDGIPLDSVITVTRDNQKKVVKTVGMCGC